MPDRAECDPSTRRGRGAIARCRERRRDDRVGSDIDCPLCDRTELPAGLHTVRTAGPFDADSVPAGLRAQHRVADATWGMLRVIDGSVVIRLDTQPATVRRLCAGDEQAIPPLVQHRLEIDAPVTLVVDFLVRSVASPTL